MKHRDNDGDGNGGGEGVHHTPSLRVPASSVFAALISVRRQRTELAHVKEASECSARALLARGGCIADTALQEAAQSVAEANSEYDRRAAALEENVRSGLLYMHALLREELRERERRAEIEGASCRREVLMATVRRRLRLLNLLAQGRSVAVSITPDDAAPPPWLLGVRLGQQVSRSSSSSSSSRVVVICERWTVANAALELEYAQASQSADATSLEGFVTLPPPCLEKVLVAGVSHRIAHAVAAAEQSTLTERCLGRAKMLAQLLKQSSSAGLESQPFDCLAKCLRTGLVATRQEQPLREQPHQQLVLALKCRAVFMPRLEAESDCVRHEESPVKMLGGESNLDRGGGATAFCTVVVPVELVACVVCKEEALDMHHVREITAAPQPSQPQQKSALKRRGSSQARSPPQEREAREAMATAHPVTRGVVQEAWQWCTLVSRASGDDQRDTADLKVTTGRWARGLKQVRSHIQQAVASQ